MIDRKEIKITLQKMTSLTLLCKSFRVIAIEENSKYCKWSLLS